MNERLSGSQENQPNQGTFRKIARVLGLDSASIAERVQRRVEAGAEFDRLSTIKYSRIGLGTVYELPAPLFSDKSQLDVNNIRTREQSRLVKTFKKLWPNVSDTYISHERILADDNKSVQSELLIIRHAHDGAERADEAMKGYWESRRERADEAMKEYWAMRLPGTVGNPGEVVLRAK